MRPADSKRANVKQHRHGKIAANVRALPVIGGALRLKQRSALLIRNYSNERNR